MSRYYIVPKILDEAGYEFLMLARDLGMYRGTLTHIKSVCQESIPESQLQLSEMIDSISKLEKCVSRASAVILESADCYENAEQIVMRCKNSVCTDPRIGNISGGSSPRIRTAPLAVRLSARPLPEWLVTVMLNFEQSL